VLDVDGVLTDGTVILGAGDEELKAFTRATARAWRSGATPGCFTTFISGRGGAAVRRRADELRIGRIWERARDKQHAFDEMLAHFGVRESQVVAMGDDVMDLPMLARSGFSAAPADAAVDVREGRRPGRAQPRRPRRRARTSSSTSCAPPAAGPTGSAAAR
jgi:3-deoxy-D-manno-octulosonate 8-phosphate phosphatase (KDO 8-P phosphatase)